MVEKVGLLVHLSHFRRERFRGAATAGLQAGGVADPAEGAHHDAPADARGIGKAAHSMSVRDLGTFGKPCAEVYGF